MTQQKVHFKNPKRAKFKWTGQRLACISPSSPVEEEEKTVFLEEGEKLIRMTSVKTLARSRNNGHPHLWIAFRPSVGDDGPAIDANMDYAGVEHPQKVECESEILWPEGKKCFFTDVPFEKIPSHDFLSITCNFL
ncbi:hypothetical protein CDAR_491861 [Caerostris darwini]|uniref:Uncharacterized protein n=1 Tax=Caerostris darwini TaxID=1538125 RepID=A0AAV4MZX5_9ARAC|nr:hypothetical protein CDAR_491861 [Caerostris darwini]